jgi:thioredoxin reductase
MSEKSQYDVIIVGGGPAGLSAALVLGRCRRQVLLLDTGKPRNGPAREVHGFLTRDGTPPHELRRLAHEQLPRYGIEIRAAEVSDVTADGDSFVVIPAVGSRLRCRMVLVATGVTDKLPDIEGMHRFFGSSVHHCPYCDGWEHRDQRIAVTGTKNEAVSLALAMKTWSENIVLCTGAAFELDPPQRNRLAEHGISIAEEPIAKLEGTDGQLERIVFRTGPALECKALFFNTGPAVPSGLIRKLDCRKTEQGSVWTDEHECTSVPGLYVAGDASRDVLFTIVAAAEGAKAALAMNKAMQKQEGLSLE